jgi:Zn-dependent protease with chaperone function
MNNFQKHIIIGTLYPISVFLFIPLIIIYHFILLIWLITLISSEFVAFILVFLTYLIDRKDKGISATFTQYLKFNIYGPLFVLILFFMFVSAYYIMTHMYIETLLYINIAFVIFLLLVLFQPISNIKYNKIPSIENNEDPKIQAILKVFKDYNIKPHIKIIDTNSVKIANGYQSDKYYIYITSYLFSNLSQIELEAVVAHEIGHLVMKHNLKHFLIDWLALVIGINGFLFALIEKRFYILIPISIAYLYIFIMLIFPLLQRKDEVKADLFACKIVGTDAVKSALVKIDNLNKTPLKFSPKYMYTFSLTLGHPSTSARIKKIK